MWSVSELERLREQYRRVGGEGAAAIRWVGDVIPGPLRVSLLERLARDIALECGGDVGSGSGGGDSGGDSVDIRGGGGGGGASSSLGAGELSRTLLGLAHVGKWAVTAGRCTLTPPDPYLKGVWFQTLHLSSEKQVSKCACNMQLAPLHDGPKRERERDALHVQVARRRAATLRRAGG